MQKLLRRNPYTPCPHTSSCNTHFSLFSDNSFFPKMMSSASAPRHSHLFKNPISTPVIPSLRLAKICAAANWVEKCGSICYGSAVPFRYRVASKKGAYGTSGGNCGRTWFASLADAADSVGVSSTESGKGESDEGRMLRRRGGNNRNSGTLLLSRDDLLKIPGVGPRNFRKLVDNGIEGVDQLKQLYKDKFLGKSNEKMIEFLQSSVGILHKSHAESITTYIRESVDEELKEEVIKPVSKKRITLCVEGNISVGKTTFLQRIANETLELRDLVEIVPEPIDKWQNVGPEHFNILDAFYAEPERYAYTFQNYVFVTRVMQERESSCGIKPLRLMERSVFSDRMVFVRAVHEAKWMNEMEISIYDSWFDPVVSSLPGLIPDGFIYLRASPDTCHKRMMSRKREEEGGVSLKYLQDLHEKHESWLFPYERGNHGVLSVNKFPYEVGNNLSSNIRDQVFYLAGDHMHSSIQKVPALVLDCEPDIDFSKDIEAKRVYARQVSEFFEFVKKNKEMSASTITTDDPTSKTFHHQLLMPNDKNVWMPGTQPLRSLDFTRPMSFMAQ